MEKYALLSLTNKGNLDILVEALIRHKFNLIATTSTALAIQELGYKCTRVEDVTQYPEMLEGRVKTLQPEIAGGILADLSKESHLNDLSDNKINPISLVVCNLYEFEEVRNKQYQLYKNNKIDLESMDQEIIEHIDIGGITLLRASAKNYRYVSLLSNPSDYQEYIEHLDNDDISIEYNKKLACLGFKLVASYDIAIANYYMQQLESDTQLLIDASLKEKLRYGENPHQDAYYYQDKEKYALSLNTSKILQGKQLSYNNILDIEAAFQSIRPFNNPCAIALKHNTPCGMGIGKDINEAYQKCFEVDSISIFGGVVIFNKPVDLKLAQTITSIFLEIIIAPSFSKEALEELSKKKNLRVIEALFEGETNNKMIRSISGGYLVQEEMIHQLDMEVVTNNKIDEDKKDILNNLYLLVKNVKSNAIVIGNMDYVLGISGGMVSRIDAVLFALDKAINHDNYQSNEELFLASDGFFPFNDIVDCAIKNNIKYIIQPGGSINDEKMVNACNENNIEMIFTHIRYFKH